MLITDEWRSRFYSKFTKDECGCWLWHAAKLNAGYGVIGVPGGNGRTITAHRLSYMMHVGDIPEGMCICHHCDTPSCVNPEHLFVGTVKDSQIDAGQKGHMARDVKCERNPKARLNREQVLEIRRLYNSADIDIPQLMNRFEATYSMIYHIVKRNNWKGIEP